MTTKFIWAEKRDIATEGAEALTEGMRQVLREKDHVVLGVCGGRSVAGIFSELKNMKINWFKVHIFMVDERFVPVTDDESNFKIIYDNLLDWLLQYKKIPESHIHPFEGDVEKYEEELKALGGEYDVLLLSSGEDGHIGALYPHHHSLKDESEYFVTMEDSPKPPPRRFTISRKMVLKATAAVILFVDLPKKDAFINFRKPSVAVDECPAKLVHELKLATALSNLKVPLEL